MNDGQIGSTTAATIDVQDYEQEFSERQVPYSTALQAVRTRSNSFYLTGPLARVNLNLDRLSPTARRVADEVGISWPCKNPFKSIVARGLELIHSFEEALGIVDAYRPSCTARVAYKQRPGTACAATEAPRGLLYHRYSVDEKGFITSAKIIPPTSQNQAQIEDDLREYVGGMADTDDQGMARDCEHLVRSYDPCISCATHFLKVKIERA